MRCYDVNFVNDHICKTDPSQKVLDSWIRIKTALAERGQAATVAAAERQPCNNRSDEIAAIAFACEKHANNYKESHSGVAVAFNEIARQLRAVR